MSGMLQILITVWLGVHPVTYTVPRQYPATNDSCERAVKWLVEHRKRKSYKGISIQCVPAAGSLA